MRILVEYPPLRELVYLCDNLPFDFVNEADTETRWALMIIKQQQETGREFDWARGDWKPRNA